jgi:hypothetical protein
MGSLFDGIEPKSERQNAPKAPILPDSSRNDFKKHKDLEKRCQQLEDEVLQFTRTDKNRKYKIEEIITLLKLLLEKEDIDDILPPAVGQIFFSIAEYYKLRKKEFQLNQDDAFVLHNQLLLNSKLLYFDVKKVFTEQLPDFAYHYYVLQTTLRF